MKSRVKIITITIFSIFLAFQIAAAEEATVSETTVGIRQLMNSADQFPDNVIVQGVVSKVFPQDNLIGLIDNPFKKDCSGKTCTTPCPSSAEKKCTKNSAKTCPMAASKCPMSGNTKKDEACAKTCDKTTSKECPMKSANDSNKTCPVAAARDAAAKCPVAGDKKCDKPCDKAVSKGCPMAAAAKHCPKTADKGCAKPCSDPGYTLILPVKWEGAMPEPSDEVRVAGKITRENGRLLFVAESITVMSN